MRFNTWDRDRFDDDEESGGQASVASEGGDHEAGGCYPLSGSGRPSVHHQARGSWNRWDSTSGSCESNLAKRLQCSGLRVRIGPRKECRSSFGQARKRVTNRNRWADWLFGIVRRIIARDAGDSRQTFWVLSGWRRIHG
jgi:hypothetical protein